MDKPKTNHNSRVVITGIGVILPNTYSVDTFWKNLSEGNSQINTITRFQTDDMPVKVAAEMNDFEWEKFLPDLDEKHARHYNRETFAIMAAMEEARRDAKLDKDFLDPSKVGFIDSSSRSSLAWWEHAWKIYHEEKNQNVFDRYSVLTSMASNPTNLTAIYANIQGFVTTITAACVGGHHAISLCYQAIRKGRAEVMYAGGHEFPLIKPLMMMYSDPASSVMSSEKDNPKSAIKPYDRNRDGFILGEGAAVLCLERMDHAIARGAKIYAEVLGTFSYNEADHAMRMDLSGKKAATGLNRLMKISGLKLGDIDYFCGHGTATINNDMAESRALKILYNGLARNKWAPLGSIKPIFGHTFGAAGIINVAATALMLEKQIICPTINLKDVDPECDHDHITEGARKVRLRNAISMAFAIGSQSSFVSLTAPDLL
ncbi:beta-ketoacyl-[acyl-carrier-protein] synthase family protein [Leptospira alstonii]|uniref:Beta-ketoacyl synthase, N-terminal domain protein n=2 Tax=Leptospira alstonii TaxID=28452 RepID=M6CJS5_9LEPT|nr:beta-ketoacyl-[acyl-carrier-protein] synthase family protein [Leptospira alstonii]EMJ90886.1 beta-ketoacyl synthase, N-terminal domain protein [Leptospira alstonii serovar Sichuan str. 79601]EQA81802.1 beta-ketoacyl synthase [Leptospira alstonii serovar Pingchang str. 80-412]